MKQKLILITGSPCVGKTTVAERLFETCEDSAYFDGDWAWCVNPFSLSDPRLRNGDKTMSFALSNYLRSGFAYVIFSSVVIIGAVGGVIALCIQPWTSQWMDVVSIYICPLGALLAGIMFFWVMKKDTALAAVHEGRTAGKKDIGGWFYPLGKWVYCAASLAALILGAIYGGIG